MRIQFLIAAFAVFFVNHNIFAVQPNCNAPAKPGVNWSKCDKVGAYLREANLTGAKS